MAEISFWLDTYDDIFSDFDPRKYHKRRLSEDFVEELKAALKYHKEPIDSLVLLLPKDARKQDIEPEVVNSMMSQLRLRFEVFYKSERKLFRRGALMALAGAIIMYLDSVIVFKGYSNYLTIASRILMEPGSWFMIWTGLDSLFYDYRKAKKETAFYKIIAGLNVRFEDI